MIRRDFLQYLGIGGMIAAVHNVDALGLTVVEKKLIMPSYGTIKIYGGDTLLATLTLTDLKLPFKPLTDECMATGVANWARIDHPK